MERARRCLPADPCTISDTARRKPAYCPSSHDRIAGAPRPYSRGNRPQRKNETVTQTCKQCGAVNSAEARVCSVCDSRLSKNNEDTLVSTGVSTGSPTRTEGNLAIAADWRSEVALRLEAYRARRQRLRADPSQPEFPFQEPEEPFEISNSAPAPPAPAISPRRYRSPRVDRVEINLAQPMLDFAGAESHPSASRADTAGQNAPILPVATLSDRRRAGLLDAALLVFAYGGFVALFWALGGRFTFSKLAAVVTSGTLGLFYAQYFALFTLFGGATPGMILRGLRVVSFDGTQPSARQLLWRSFGYLISAGTVALGFLWALWDEDHLSWHDRISQTYLTAVDPALDPPVSNEVSGQTTGRHEYDA